MPYMLDSSNGARAPVKGEVKFVQFCLGMPGMIQQPSYLFYNTKAILRFSKSLCQCKLWLTTCVPYEDLT